MRPRRVAIGAIAALTLLAVALLYLLFPSADYTGDGTLFADLVRHAGVDGSTEFHRLFLHPHHLAYGPLGAMFQRALGSPPDGVRNVEILRLVHLSSLLATTALLVFLIAVWRATGDTAAAVLGTLLLAFSGAFWAYAVNVEVQPLVLLSLCLFLLALVNAPSTSNAGWLGLSVGFAILCHGLQVLLVVPAVVHLWPLEGRRRLHALALFASVGAAAAGIPYLLALPWTAGGSPAGAVAWLRPRYGMGYASGPVEGLSRALAGLWDVFIGPPHPVAGRASAFGAALRLLVPGLVIGAVLLARGQRATEAGRRLARGALWTLAAYL
ncbi:MAG: glycosyltransferase family 39 protein, partial [Acidobacteriota bacterium]